MPYTTLDPTTIESPKDITKVLSDIERYRKDKRQKDVGVALRQNRQFGGTYVISSREHAQRMMKRRGSCEWYVEFWPRKYFEDLRRKY